MPEFDPFFLFWVLRDRVWIRSLLLFRVLWHCAQIRSLLFVLGSPASCLDSVPSLDSIPSFCFGFSDIVPGFDPFFCFGFSDIVPRFNPLFCFRFSDIVPGFDPFFLFRVLRHRARIRSLLLVSSSLALCPDQIHSFYFGLSDIMLGFDPFFLFRVLRHCVRITYLPRHRARVSLSPLVVVTRFR